MAYQHNQPPPSYDYSAGYPHEPQDVVVIQPTATQVLVTPQVGPDPTMITCPSCRSTVVTRMEYEPSTKTHIVAGILCIFGCWLCCCIPYCVDSCQNGNHYCSNCGAYVGTYSH